MNWTVFDSDEDLDAALLRGDLDVKVDRGLGETARAAVGTDNLALTNVDLSATGVVNYLALIPTASPLERKECREAIMYALDKADLAQIRGGVDVMRIVGSMASPALPGGPDDINPYRSGADGSGDLEAARRKLVQCGYPDGFEVRMAYTTIGVGQATYESVQRSLARVGIVVDPVKYDNFPEYFSSGVGSPATVQDKRIGIVAASWSPEAASPLSYWAPIADSRRIKLRANLNYPELTEDRVNRLLDEIETGNPDVARISRAIDGMVMESACYLPYGAEQLVLYRGSQVAGVYVQQALGGQYDLVNIGRIGPAAEE
jgi:peptide/nickel transport system substrate-binding protein